MSAPGHGFGHGPGHGPGPDPGRDPGGDPAAGSRPAAAAARRPTRQQLAVATALAASADFVSAQQLHARMRADGSPVGLATVYRTLASLAADGGVDVLRTDDGEAVYRACSLGHHHHLVCRSCGRAVEVDLPVLERWADEVSRAHGFRDVRHTVEILGTCPAC